MATLADAHFIDADITSTASGTGSWTSTTQSRTTAHPQDYAHIEGQAVQVLDDGVKVTGRSISSGALSGDALTGTLHIGLKYTSTLKPTKLDLEQMGLLLTKIITKAVVSFYNSLSGKVGTSTTAMETISSGSTLFTGIKEVPLHDGYDREGSIIVTQEDPLPLTVRGMILLTGAHNKT